MPKSRRSRRLSHQPPEAAQRRHCPPQSLIALHRYSRSARREEELRFRIRELTEDLARLRKEVNCSERRLLTFRKIYVEELSDIVIVGKLARKNNWKVRLYLSERAKSKLSGTDIRKMKQRADRLKLKLRT